MPIIEKKIINRIKYPKLYNFIVGSKYTSYKNYLQSEHWKDVKRRFYKSKLNHKKCYVCGRQGKLQLHYRTYKRIGREYLHDLIQLCGTCHLAAHKLLENARTKGNTRINLWTAAKRLKKIRPKRRKRKRKKKNYKKKKAVGVFTIFR